jgi:hypothetical protein
MAMPKADLWLGSAWVTLAKLELLLVAQVKTDLHLLLITTHSTNRLPRYNAYLFTTTLREISTLATSTEEMVQTVLRKDSPG